MNNTGMPEIANRAEQVGSLSRHSGGNMNQETDFICRAAEADPSIRSAR